MSGICDLHTHSVFSDGTCTPEEIVEGALACGLSAVALTDHNTVSGLKRFVQAARGTAVEAVPGIEISSVHEQQEVHMLGLCLPEKGWAFLQENMVEVNRRKDESNRLLVQALAKNGYPVDYEALIAATPDHHINRGHIGHALVQLGCVKSIREALETVLSPQHGYYRPPERLSAMEAIRLIRKAGGVPVMAHPFLNMTEQQLRVFLPAAKENGLAGMETVYSLYDEKTAACAAGLAREMGLKESGGSDFHGAIKPDIALGLGRGNLHIPYAYFRQLNNG